MHGWLKKRLGSLSLIPMTVVLALSLFLPAHTARAASTPPTSLGIRWRSC